MPLLIQQNKLSILSSLNHHCEGKTDNQKGKYFGLHISWHDKKMYKCNNSEIRPRRQCHSIWTSEMNCIQKVLSISNVKMLYIFKNG